MDPDILTRQNLSSTLEKLILQESSGQRSVRSATQPSTPPTIAPTSTSILTSSSLSVDKGPMQLLDLPLDVLKDIVTEVTHTTDLTSLALTCSTLHGLAVPLMYARFDIVWPESLNPTEDYSGVDALSYGLSTLVMGEDVFHQMPISRDHRSVNACSNCGCKGQGKHNASKQMQTSTGFSSRRGNHYAQYTRTFSIGNGPLSWVQEYSVNREIGKMLGTLVALAVARMDNLEAFIWDMPTGVVREIWLALGSLSDRLNHECRLDRVWVRWHDNSESQTRIPTTTAAGRRRLQNYQHVEHPSLSVLPPLRNLAVLDIDETAYVEEMAVLIERSRHRLVELRIGIAQKAHLSPWILCEKEKDTTTSSESSSNWPRVGGILSILTKHDVPEPDEISSSPNLSTQSDDTLDSNSFAEDALPDEKHVNLDHTASFVDDTTIQSEIPSPYCNNDKLNLQVFELERVPLSVSSLLPTLDWTRLTTLTLMQCEDHEQLWRALRRKYAPPPTVSKRQQNGDYSRSNHSEHDYSLKIKHLRTDTVSPYLMLFIKDALAPNTLESVFLHQALPYESSVQIEAIYRHIIRKHRLSLRKILIDASDRRDHNPLPLGPDRHWHKWMLNHEMIAFVTSGRMPQLKEIGMAMHYRDWHYFLQRLPNMSQLRALYLPHIRESVHRDLKELALQVLDIVSIRPELKIAYVGLENKCYQILEGGPHESDPDSEDANHDEHSSDPDDDNSEWHSVAEDDAPEQNQELLSSDISDDDDDDEPGKYCSSRIQFKLQEILFYDDKISIFKARHGVI